MADVAHLPIAKGLPLIPDLQLDRRQPGRVESRQANKPPNRNKTLFAEARRVGLECRDHDELLHRLRGINSVLFPTAPLPNDEVQRMARTVWGYVEQGRCFAPGSEWVVFRRDDWNKLSPTPAALVLCEAVRRAHPSATGREQFAISPIAIAPTLPGKWDAKKVRENRTKIIEAGLLTQTYQGGKGAGDPSHFALPNKGGKSIHNTTYTPGASVEGVILKRARHGENHD